MKKSPCSYGWTDHSFRRLMFRMQNGIQEKLRYKRKRRFISNFNELVFHTIKFSDELPF